jgi:hypothetical protein
MSFGKYYEFCFFLEAKQRAQGNRLLNLEFVFRNFKIFIHPLCVIFSSYVNGDIFYFNIILQDI